MTFKVDLEGVEAWAAGQILPPGSHNVEVVEAKEGESGTGKPQLELELLAYEGEYEGGTIRDWIVVIPKTAGKVKQLLAAFGVGDLDSEVAFEAEDLKGKKAQILVRNEPYDGKDRSRVKAYEPVGELATASNGSGSEDDLPF